MNTLPPIGCNGRGAQQSSPARPVSLTEAPLEEQFRLVKEAGVFDCFDRLPGAGEVARYRDCIARHALPVHTSSWFYARGVPFWFTLDYSHAIFKIGNAQELAICGLTEDVAAGRAVLDPRRHDSFVDQWLAMGIVRWLQVRAVAPNGPRNVWSIADPTLAVAAVPEHSIFPYRAGEPGRGILYPFTEPAEGEWHSPWEDAALDCTRAVVRKVLQHHHEDADSPLRWITTEMINLPDYAHNARFSLIGQNAAIAAYVRRSWDEIAAAPA